MINETWYKIDRSPGEDYVVIPAAMGRLGGECVFHGEARDGIDHHEVRVGVLVLQRPELVGRRVEPQPVIVASHRKNAFDLARGRILDDLALRPPLPSGFPPLP
jgi:hypothetical protein